MNTGIGHSVRRKEDLRLVTGQGCFSADYDFPNLAHGIVVRSPHAHARILDVDVAEARAMPGVLAVLTAADAAADGLKVIPHTPSTANPADIVLKNRDGTPHKLAPHAVLAGDAVRFVGTPVAFVVAGSIDAAKDAAERVRVSYAPLPALTVATEAAGDAAASLYDAVPNVCIDADVGDIAATETAFATATHVVRFKTWVQRVAGVHMEPRAASGVYDAATDRTTLYAGSGGVVRQKREISEILGIPLESVRVVCADIGGNFGTRNAIYPEFALVVWAARRLRRPVKWVCERGEAFQSDYQGRDLAVEVELALDRSGRFLAMRGSNVSNVGAHSLSYVPLTKGMQLMSSVYDLPAVHFRGRAVLSTTPPTNPYRSAGRPEVMFVMERLIDLAAREHGFDRVKLRRKNLIREDAMPYANPQGITYDSGAYEKAMNDALALGDWAGFAARRREARKRGRRRGIGVANYVETTTGAPRERALITVYPERRVDVVIGTLSSGQGHETAFAQCVSDWLGVPFEAVNLIQGDTDIVTVGGGSHSARSMRMGGIVMGKASDAVIARGKRIAAFMLEAAEGDIGFADGRFSIQGTDRSVGIFEAAAAATRADLPEDLRGPLAAECDEMIRTAGFPYGSHVCEVEIDPETGSVEIARYAAVDDVGRAINPLILHGQTHGGIVQGVGQALLEQCVYERETGQLLSGSFMDYAMPRADDFPGFDTAISETLSPTNPLGVRGGGEGGTTPALGVVANAVVDALAEYGVRHIELPLTPERVWRAIRQASPPPPKKADAGKA